MRVSAALVLALALGGCAGTPSNPLDGAPGQARDAAAFTLAQWSAVGRILLRTPEESWHATLDWRQTGDNYHIRLTAPLGQGTVELDGGPWGVSLRTRDDEAPRHARDPETLLLDTLGWRVPVAGLRYWILGLPDPRAAIDHARRDAAGRLETLGQSGWSVRYPRYDTATRPVLPAKVYLEHPRFTVRIVVTRWVPGAV